MCNIRSVLFLSLAILFNFQAAASEPNSNLIGRVVHNYQAKNSCWQLTESEFKLLNKSCEIKIKPLFGDYKYIFSQIIFQKADELYKKRSQCFMKTLSHLSDPSNEVSQHFKNSIVSGLALYFKSRGRVERLKKFRSELALLKPNENRSLSADEIIEAGEGYNDEIEDEEKSQATYLEMISFTDDENIKELLINWGQKSLGEDTRAYSADQKELEKKLEVSWKKNSPLKELISNLRLYSEKQSLSSNEYKAFLSSSGLKYEAFEQVIGSDSISEFSKKKLESCLESEYGKSYQALELAKETGLNTLYFVAGAAGVSGASSTNKAIKFLANVALSAKKFNFWLGGLSSLTVLNAPDSIAKKCLKIVDAKKIDPKKSCTEGENLNLDEFFVEKMKYRNCIMSLLEVVP